MCVYNGRTAISWASRPREQSAAAYVFVDSLKGCRAGAMMTLAGRSFGLYRGNGRRLIGLRNFIFSGWIPEHFGEIAIVRSRSSNRRDLYIRRPIGGILLPAVGVAGMLVATITGSIAVRARRAMDEYFAGKPDRNHSPADRQGLVSILESATNGGDDRSKPPHSDGWCFCAD